VEVLRPSVKCFHALARPKLVECVNADPLVLEAAESAGVTVELNFVLANTTATVPENKSRISGQ